MDFWQRTVRGPGWGHCSLCTRLSRNTSKLNIVTVSLEVNLSESDCFFLGYDFTIQTISMETDLSCIIFVFESMA